MAGGYPLQAQPVTQGQQQNHNQPNPSQNPYGNTGSNYSQPSYVPLGSFNPNQTISYLNQGFQGTDANAANQLNQTLADFGINGGQAVDAMGNLQSQLASAQAPTIANAIQNSQGMQLQGGEFNAGAFNNQQQQIMNAIFGMMGGGQGAGNQNANQYGSTVTQTPSIWNSIFQGLQMGGQAAGMAGGFSGPGGGSPLPGYGENTSPGYFGEGGAPY
jgi:hypothetical protein